MLKREECVLSMGLSVCNAALKDAPIIPNGEEYVSDMVLSSFTPSTGFLDGVVDESAPSLAVTSGCLFNHESNRVLGA